MLLQAVVSLGEPAQVDFVLRGMPRERLVFTSCAVNHVLIGAMHGHPQPTDQGRIDSLVHIRNRVAEEIRRRKGGLVHG